MNPNLRTIYPFSFKSSEATVKKYCDNGICRFGKVLGKKRTYLENTLLWYPKPTHQANQKRVLYKCAIGVFSNKIFHRRHFSNHRTHNKESSCKAHDATALMVLFVTSRLTSSPDGAAQKRRACCRVSTLNGLMKTSAGVRPNNKMANSNERGGQPDNRSQRRQ